MKYWWIFCGSKEEAQDFQKRHDFDNIENGVIYSNAKGSRTKKDYNRVAKMADKEPGYMARFQYVLCWTDKN